MKRLTISVPSYGRKRGTIRSIECIAKQTIDSWEALIVGDGCPIMQDFIDSNYFSDLQKEMELRGNDLKIWNEPNNRGGSGFAITNENIKRASGEFFIFYSNDDIIKENHFENYLSQIENTDYDFVYFNSWVDPYQAERVSKFAHGHIGHSEIIVRTDFLRKMPEHTPEYGHDWLLISAMKNSGKHKKCETCPPTYWVMSTFHKREKDLD
jgi:GT2 family glycosyltransferase